MHRVECPDFTIVTPSYNKGKFIGDTVESVLEQRGVRIEYIIQDACSTDETDQIVQALRVSDNMRVFLESGNTFEYRREKDRGQSHAINLGFSRGRGRIFGWLNADDKYYDNSLASVLMHTKGRRGKWAIYGDLDYLNEDGSVKKRRPALPFDRKFLLNACCFIPQPACFFSRDVYQANGPLDESLDLCMDYEYWLRASQSVPFYYIPTVLAGLRLMDSTKTGASPLIAMPEALAVGRRYGAKYFNQMRFAYWLLRLGLDMPVKFVGRRILASRKQ